jgi:hypothetical protein
LKLRHAVLLGMGIVGWYLVMPPLKPPNGFDLKAPISQWDILQSFDVGEDCEQTKMILATENKGKPDATSARVPFGHCIAACDPRLKSN